MQIFSFERVTYSKCTLNIKDARDKGPYSVETEDVVYRVTESMSLVLLQQNLKYFRIKHISCLFYNIITLKT